MNTMPAVGVNISVVLFGRKISCRTEVVMVSFKITRNWDVMTLQMWYSCAKGRSFIYRETLNIISRLLFLYICGSSRNSAGG